MLDQCYLILHRILSFEGGISIIQGGHLSTKLPQILVVAGSLHRQMPQNITGQLFVKSCWTLMHFSLSMFSQYTLFSRPCRR